MANTRASKKRPASQPEVQRPSRQQRRRTQQVEKPKPATTESELLNLPWEIRQIIFRDLLWQPDPVFFESLYPPLRGPEALLAVDKPQCAEYWTNIRNDRPISARLFYPEILSTCKQLYEEGSLILYDNSIKCQVICHDDYTGFWQILGSRYSMETPVPSVVLTKMRRASVMVHQYSEKEEDNWGELYAEVRNSLRKLVDILRLHKWESLTLELMAHDKRDAMSGVSEPDPLFKSSLFRQFQRMRGCDEVSIHGIAQSLATEIRHSMMSSSAENPVFDLDQLYDAITGYFQSVIANNDSYQSTDEIAAVKSAIKALDELDNAKEEFDLKSFWDARCKVLRLAGRIVLLQQETAFRFDPTGTPSLPPGTRLTLDNNS